MLAASSMICLPVVCAVLRCAWIEGCLCSCLQVCNVHQMDVCAAVCADCNVQQTEDVCAAVCARLQHALHGAEMMSVAAIPAAAWASDMV